MTFYLKYRPRNLSELDLTDVGESLGKIVKSGNIPHAFLFSGPKGTGKTSAARILAKIIDCENLGKDGTPCDNCEQCISISKGNNLDVIEMDAASHRGIDDVRSLRDAVKLSPTLAKKKIYIIDEAHMLTTEASNALLKTLEEPPEHVIFILATTNPEKLIDTIRSRTTLISFRKAGIAEIVKSLKRVVDNEKIKISDVNLTKIAEAANGAFRDAIKILEQFSLEGESYLDGFQKSDLSTFIDCLVKKDEKLAIDEIEKNIALGISMENFLKNLLEEFHKAILSESELFSKDDLIKLFEVFTEANKNLIDSPIEALPVEIAVMKWCGDKDKSDGEGVMSREKIIKKSEPAPAEEQNNESRIMNYEEKKESEPSDIVIQTSSQTSTQMVNDNIWQNILLAVRPINASIEGLLRSSKPVAYDGKILTLGVFYKFHKERLEDVHHKKILEDVLEKILNNPTRIVCTLVDPPAKVVIQEARVETVLTETKEPDILKVAEELFGN